MLGKIFVTALATGLCMLMMSTAKRVESGNLQLKIPNNSIDSPIKNLELVRAYRRKNANAWVRIPAKRRRLFELLKLREPLASFVRGACKAEFRQRDSYSRLRSITSYGTISCTSSFLMGFTRSSRFTPRYMAIAAATNTDE